VESVLGNSSSPNDIILLPKVQAEDLSELTVGQVVWGWPHCVHEPALTQVAIDRRLTLIASEAMNHWQADGGFGLHVFTRTTSSRVLSVLHAMQLAGITGSYGRRLRASVIGFSAFNAGTLIVDVSCDMGMGFKLGAPDSFTQPVIEVANGVHYYAVDHSPSYLWNSATWEISEALLPHIEPVLAGPQIWNSTRAAAWG
jgi:alanine dehydrogenase